MKALRFMVAGGLMLVAGAGAAFAPREVEKREATPAAAAAFKVDGVHSVVIFRIHREAGTFFGRFNEISGSFLLDEANPSNSTLDFTVNLDKVDTANERRDNHLRSPDFFNTAINKTATFKSKTVTASGDGAFTATGDFSMMGVTKPVTVKISRLKTVNSRRGEMSGFEAEFKIRRSEFGMTGFADSLSDEVTLMVGIEGNR